MRDHRCENCQAENKPACQCFLNRTPAARRKVNLQKSDHFLCLKCNDQTYPPYWDGAEYFDGFYCEAHGTWRFIGATNQWILGM